MERKTRTILAHSHGLESKKISGRRRSVFLDFPFYRTSQDVADLLCGFSRVGREFPDKSTSLGALTLRIGGSAADL